MRATRLLAGAAIVGGSLFGLWDIAPAHATDVGYIQATTTCEIPSGNAWEVQYYVDLYTSGQVDQDYALTMSTVACYDFGGQTTDYTEPALTDALFPTPPLVPCNPPLPPPARTCF
jgi:hypothetical protein